MKVLIAADHAGFELKQKLIADLSEISFEDLGCHSLDSVDYPDFAKKLTSKIVQEQKGLLICGSGQGMAISANKAPDIRAALCWTKEIAALARQHNNANVLCLPSRFLSIDEAKEILTTFLNTEFEGGRHQRRVDKITN